jgi:hypothetical protein
VKESLKVRQALNKRSYHTKSNSIDFTTLKQKDFNKNKKKDLFCFDIETININNKQIPVLITFAYFTKNKSISTFEVLINYNKLSINPLTAVIDL